MIRTSTHSTHEKRDTFYRALIHHTRSHLGEPINIKSVLSQGKFTNFTSKNYVHLIFRLLFSKFLLIWVSEQTKSLFLSCPTTVSHQSPHVQKNGSTYIIQPDFNSTDQNCTSSHYIIHFLKTKITNYFPKKITNHFI